MKTAEKKQNKSQKKVAVQKNLGGRPRTTIENRLNAIIINFDTIFELMKCGLTDQQLGSVLGVTEMTINRWKKDKRFLLSLKKGKEFADTMVEMSLFRRAIGYSFDSEVVKTVSLGGNGGSVVEKVPIVEHCPPDTTACIFWLKNRKKDEWRDKISVSIAEFEGFKAAVIQALGVLPVEMRNAVIATIKTNASIIHSPSNC